MSRRQNLPSETELRDEMDFDRAVRRPGKPHGVVVSVRLDEGEARELRSMAEVEHRTLSQLVRQAINSYLTSPATDWRVADLPRTSGGGSAAGRIRIQLTSQRLSLGEADVVESVEANGRVSSTGLPVRIHTAR